MGGVGFYRKMDLTLAEAVLIYSQLDLLFEPGTKWQYSNPGIAALGRIVEVLSGQRFEEFLAARVFAPLGMKDTFVFPPAEKYARIADVLSVQPNAKPTGMGELVFRKGAKYSMPEGGLYSTATDLLAFYQMHLNGGTLNGKRLLSRASVETMTKWQNTGMTPAAHNPGQGYGLSWAVVKEPLGELVLTPSGTYGHGGAFGTLGMVDPKNNAVFVLLVQRTGVPADTGRSAFLEIAEAALSA
jgi:CubicO group peptidase (beta-lactamase class C family)